MFTFRHNGGCPLQKGFLPSISEVPDPRRSGLCHERSTWRNMWELFRGTLTGSQANIGWILLAHYVEGCTVLCEGMWQVPTLQQHHAATNWGTYTNERPLAFHPMGIRHSWAFSLCHMVAQIPCHRDPLLHQMGWGKTIGHYHREKCLELHLGKHHLRLRNPQGLRLW